MPDGSLTMPAVAHDDMIGGHNLFFQHSSGILFGYNGTVMIEAARWNCTATVVRQGAGIYRVVHGAFDSLVIETGGIGPAGHGYLPHVSIIGDNAAVTTTFKFPYLVRVDGNTIDVYIRDPAGAAIELDNAAGFALEYVSLVLIGRRVTTVTTPFSTFGSIAGTTIDGASLNGT